MHQPSAERKTAGHEVDKTDSTPHDSSITHVTGESIYVNDNAKAPDELFVDLFVSPVANGKIIKLDLEKARRLEGIVGLYTHHDLPGTNRLHSKEMDQPLLAENYVRYVGEPIVVIAAANKEAAREARKKIKIEIKKLEPIFTIDEAIKKESYIGPVRKIARGNPDDALENCAHVIEGSLESAGQEHFYLETQVALAHPGEQGQIVVETSSQHPTEVQHDIASILKLGYHQVVCTVKRIGGGFGGKEAQAAPFAVMAALVAHRTGRRARIALTTEDDMSWTGKRHPFTTTYSAGFSAEGEIVALKLRLHANGGAYSDLSIPILERALFHCDNAYYIPHIELVGRVCRTNLPPNTAFRGFGGPQGMLVTENIIEEIAFLLKQDAFVIRQKNLYGINERNITPYGQVVENNVLHRLFSDLSKSANYGERKKEVEEFNRTSVSQLRGISLTPIKFGISFTTRFLNQASALVNVHLDGTIQVSTGACEMGQGVNAKIRSLVAEAFGVPHSNVLVMPTSTEKNHNTSPTAASSGADLNGAAALNACEKIKQRLKVVAVSMAKTQVPDAKLEIEGDGEITEKVFFTGEKVCLTQSGVAYPLKAVLQTAYFNRVSLGDHGYYKIPKIYFDPEQGQGRAFLYFTQGACCSEVLIDRFTGEVKVVRADILMDLGRSLNEAIDRGQIKGAFLQGLGWLTLEELKYSPAGELLSRSPTTYKIPAINDLPEIFNINLLENGESEVSLKRSKAVGEPPFMLALSVWTAIKHALGSAVNRSATAQMPKLKAPATAEEILLTLENLV